MPEWKSEIRRSLAAARLDAAREAELVEEMTQFLDDRYEELRAEGASDADARRAVLAELAASDRMAAKLRQTERRAAPEPLPEGGGKSTNLAADLWRDLRYAARAMRKRPAFTLFVSLTLGLGIGANTAVFTIVNTLLLNPLPIRNTSQLVAIDTVDTKSPGRLLAVSYANLLDLRRNNQVFSDVAGYTPVMPLTLSRGGGSERVFAEFVTANYFTTLGLVPVQGRFFAPDEDQTPGAHPVAVLGFGAWQQRFGAAPDILGRSLRLNGLEYTIVGIAPPGFKGVSAIFGPDLWIPAMMAGTAFPVQLRQALRDRGELDFLTAAHLHGGVSFAQAEANVATVAAALEKEYPDANRGRGARLRTLTAAALGESRQPLLFGTTVLMAIVGLVLLIACANVANLLLARAAGRRQEIALRLALGAGRGRLVRQLLAESTLLALLGGVAGLGIAYEGCQLLLTFRPAEVVPNLFTLQLDAPVFLFALCVSLLTGLVFGLVPALRSSRPQLAETLKEESRMVGRSRRRVTFANGLLVGQVALSLISLITAALFLRSIQQAYAMDPGFQTKNLALVLMSPGQAGYDRTRTEQLYRDLRTRIAAIPGIQSVSWATNLPLFARPNRGIAIEGADRRRASDAITTIVNTVDLDYFETVAIPLTRGRDFRDTDREQATAVAIVNETLAARYWPNQDAIGKRFQVTGENGYRQIVGVVKTANYTSLAEDPQPCVYLPARQAFSDSMTLFVRTTHDPSSALPAVLREVRLAAGPIDTSDARTGRKLIEQALFSQRIGVSLLSVFGALALGLACVGLYGIMAYSVNQRRKEIGLRMALGAAQSEVLRLVLTQGMRLVAVGIVVGLAGSLLVGRALSRLLYGVSATDPLSLIAASLALAGVAFLACYLPARNASRVDPVVALREG